MMIYEEIPGRSTVRSRYLTLGLDRTLSGSPDQLQHLGKPNT